MTVTNGCADCAAGEHAPPDPKHPKHCRCCGNRLPESLTP